VAKATTGGAQAGDGTSIDEQSAALLVTARASLDAKDNNGAIAALKELVALVDCRPEVRLEAAGLFAAAGAKEEAIGSYLQAGNGFLYDDADMTRARQAFMTAHEIDPVNVDVIFQLGQADVVEGRTQDALAKFIDVLRRSNLKHVPALFEAGCIYQANGQHDQAILAFKKVIDRDKSHSQAFVHMGQLHQTKGMVPEALGYYVHAADIAREAGHVGTARQLLNMVLALDSSNQKARFMLDDLEDHGAEAAEEAAPLAKPIPKAAAAPKPAAKPQAAVQAPAAAAPETATASRAAEQSLAAAKADLAGVSTQRDGIVEEIDRLGAACAELEAELLSRKADAEKSQRQESDDALHAGRDRAELKSELAELAGQRLATELELESVKSTVETLRAEREQAETDIALLRAQSDAATLARAAQEASLRDLESARATAKSEMDALRAQSEAAAQAKGAQEAALRELETKRAGALADVDSLQAQSKVAAEARAAQEKALHELEAARASVKSEMDALLTQSKAAAEAKLAQEAALRDLEGKRAGASADVDALLAQGKTAAQAKAAQEAALHELDAARAAAKLEMETLQAQSKAAAQARAAQETALHELEAARAAAKIEMDSLQAQSKAAAQAKTAQETALHELEAARAAAKAEMDALLAQSKAAAQTKAAQEAALRELEGKRAGAIADVDLLLAQSKEAAQLKAAQESALQELEAARSAAKLEMDALLAQSKAAAQAKAIQEAALRELEGRRTAAKAEMDALDAQKSAAEKLVSDASERSGRVVKAQASVEATIAELTAERETAETAKAAEELALRGIEARRTHAQAELDDLLAQKASAEIATAAAAVAADALAAEEQALKKLVAERKKLDMEVEALHAERAAAEETVLALRAIGDEASREKEATHATIVSDLAKTQTALAELESKKHDLDEAYANSKSLAAAAELKRIEALAGAEKAEAVRAKREADAEALGFKLVALEAALKDTDAKAKQFAGETLALEEISAKVGEQRYAALELQAAKAEAQGELTQLRSNIATAETELTGVRATLDSEQRRQPAQAGPHADAVVATVPPEVCGESLRTIENLAAEGEIPFEVAAELAGLIHEGRAVEALRVARARANVVAAPGAFLLAVGDLSRDLGDVNRARDAYRLMASLDPKKASLSHARLGELFLTFADQSTAAALQRDDAHFASEKDPAAALETYADLVARFPDDPQFREELGALHEKVGNKLAAGVAYGAAMVLYLGSDDHVRANELVPRLLAVRPDDGAALELAARAYDRAGRSAESAAMLDRALAAYGLQHHASDVERVCRQLAETAEDPVPYRRELAKLLQAVGDRSGAIEQLIEAAERLVQWSRGQEALAALKDAEALAGDDPIFAERISALKLKAADAVKAVDESVRGDLFLSKGEFEKAADAYRRAVAENPNDAGASYQLACLLTDHFPDYDTAEKLLETAAAIRPGHTATRYRLAVVKAARGEIGQAIELLIALARFDDANADFIEQFVARLERTAESGDVAAKYNLGIAYRELGRVEEALVILQSIQREPEFVVRCLNAIGLCLRRQGLDTAAAKRFQKAIETSGFPEGQYNDALYNLGDLYESKTDQESLALSLSSFEELYARDCTYRDVADKIRSVKNKIGSVEGPKVKRLPTRSAEISN